MNTTLMGRPTTEKKGNPDHRDTEEVRRFIHLNDNMVRRVAVLQLQHQSGTNKRRVS